MQFHPLFTQEYLFSHWGNEFEQYVAQIDSQVLLTLKQWADRDASQSETQLEGQFVQRFFIGLWEYIPTGSTVEEKEYSLHPQYLVPGAGQSGGSGRADLALGMFKRTDIPDIPQALCEFKDISSALDAPQKRKGKTRSPVVQCLDYLKHAFDKTPVESTLFPTWGIVTDMNEFRLYYRKVGQGQSFRFTIDASKAIASGSSSLIDKSEHAQRERFLFWKMFRRDSLLAPFGRSKLEKLFESQIVQEKNLEKSFYLEYKAFRQYAYETIVDSNPNFSGTRKELVRLTQRLLDRCVFLLFCEDMGKTLGFPTNLIRDVLMEASKSSFYSSTGNDIWARIKDLFEAMREGGVFPPDHSINRFNGGLFETNERLEELKIPNRLFCSAGQGESPEAISSIKNTLLYLSASYNFGAEGVDRQKTITLYALGRIFEQSITELEYMEAEADAVESAKAAGKDEAGLADAKANAQSIASLSNRKRNGVYYTPEWVTSYIVRETVGVRLADERERLGLEIGSEFSKIQMSEYRRQKKRGSNKANPINDHRDKLDKYADFLHDIKICDPACGSGAFLIQTLNFLIVQHRIVDAERERIDGKRPLLDYDAVIREILTKNLYGVDLSPESVEITQLALWLNTASRDQPLSSLDHHIREGNSLVGPDFNRFYQDKHKTLFEQLDPNIREAVNVFDWHATFPEVFGPDVDEDGRGFDCVIGNPPYVKLQNFRKLKPDESDYLTHSFQGVPVYASAQNGNFDLYLPFIEKGLSLLNAKGRMGYIAPSVWLKNEYGKSLRSFVKNHGYLDRWVDFGSFQVFEDVTVYTALQLFSKAKRPYLRFSRIQDSNVSRIDWKTPPGKQTYKLLDSSHPWVLSYADDGRLLQKLKNDCLRLDDESLTSHIFQGLITSADWIYHLRRCPDGSFVQIKRHPDGSEPDGISYALEPVILRPIVSGEETKRYRLPVTDTYILFPYDVSKKQPDLFLQSQLSNSYPKSWDYLLRYAPELRARENASFDDEQWYRFGRNQGIDKQKSPKLLVPRLVENVNCVVDEGGKYCLDNVDVGGVIARDPLDLFFLAGCINSPVCSFVFKKISKPFRGDYFSANKQFIAPLPIPKCNKSDKAKVSKLARGLQALHTNREAIILKLQSRIDSPQCTPITHDERWLFADVKPATELRAQAPATQLTAQEKSAWAKAERKSRLDTHLERIDAMLRPGLNLVATAEDDSLSVSDGQRSLILKYGLDQTEAEYLAALWNQFLRQTNITAKFTADKLIKKLLTYRSTDDDGLRKVIITMNKEIQSLDTEIQKTESELNQITYRLYKLTPDEIALVEAG